MIRKASAIAIALGAAVVSLSAEITFSTPFVNDDNQIIFGVTHQKAGETSYQTFFTSDVMDEDARPQQITSYPEKLSVLMGGDILRVRNRYGTTHYNVNTGALLHSSVEATATIPTASVIPAAESVSPDGKWICSIQRTGPVEGKIVLRNAAGYTETDLVEKTELSYHRVPVRWSPDSKFLVYEKEGNLYFTEPAAMFKSHQVPEHLRKVGKGNINCIFWASPKNLIYITNDLVYRIPIYELYTRTLYSDFVGVGTIVGRLPHPFAATDTFSVNSDCTAMVMANHQRTVSYLSLPGSATFVRQLYTGTQVSMVGSTQVCSFFWDSRGNPLLWFQYHTVGNTNSHLYRLESIAGQLKATLLNLPQNAMAPLISPDGTHLMFRTREDVQVFSVDDWLPMAELDCVNVIDYSWRNQSTIFIGTAQAVLGWNMEEGTQNDVEVLFPVSAVSYGWNPKTGNPAIETHWGIMEYNQEAGTWTPSELSQLEEPRSGNDSYRVFLDSSPNANFSNMPYIRTITGAAVTRPLYKPAAKSQAARPRVALALDATDNADGLAKILQVLEHYKIRATFFINGEFLRRYPAETGRIVKAEQECGSMFFTATDLTSNEDFVVDTDFIRQGLARNEDEFFSLTDKELSVIWHTPYYASNDKILEAGRLAGYTYVDRSLNPLDSVTFEQAAANDISTYKSSGEIIEDIVNQLEDGMVIPVAVGVGGGSRNDYLYDKLDLLIVAILDAGYDIVSVGQLLQE